MNIRLKRFGIIAVFLLLVFSLQKIVMAQDQCIAEITSPTPGQICNTSQEFCWNSCNSRIFLGVGTSLANVDGSSSYGDIFAGTVTGGCQTVNNIPSSGTLYVRFWYKVGSGSWQSIYYTYTLDCGG